MPSRFFQGTEHNWLLSNYKHFFLSLSSDLFTVSSLLVQKLIKQIRHAFITPDGNNTKPNVGVYSVVQFLKQDINCYIMLTLSLVCHKVRTIKMQSLL